MTTWKEHLDQCGIQWRGAPPGPLPTEVELAAAEERLKVTFPASYRSFCTEIGPGRLGDLLEIIVPWNVKGFLATPRGIHRDLASFVDASNGSRTKFTGKAIQIGVVVLGPGPVPRPFTDQCGPLFFAASEPTSESEWALYALDRRQRASAGETPPRLVKLARSFTDLVLQGFCQRRLAKLPFVAAPTEDQFRPEFHPRQLPTAATG
ncbi:SMI1/KNR4 family protein [Archangium lansingense]|uniref:SMI1/KNR4 family protein n=1 Tax=Archangium lansingense TaxID=2995310 RepID=A0ABT3ZXQ8_9BACT|nr:SMI1/KNR4 family protein [Archangium lansinium]MCY1074096.1 SMI1/KNR4 family protein [Archangium lansinium]